MAEDNIIQRTIRAVFDRASAEKVERQFEESLTKAGERAGAGFLRELRQEFDKKRAQLAEQLARGTISEREVKKQSEAAARAFNQALLASMDKARKAGTLTDREYVKLTRTLKRVGDDGAKSAGLLHSSFGKVVSLLGGFFAARTLLRWGADLFRTGNEANAVWNRLAGTLEIAGVQFSDVEQELRKTARAMQDTTAVGDEDFANILTELVSISGDYQASLRNVGLVADIAAAKQIDFETAATLVGKAIVGETGTLKRYGIVVREGTDALEAMRQKFAG